MLSHPKSVNFSLTMKKTFMCQTDQWINASKKEVTHYNPLIQSTRALPVMLDRLGIGGLDLGKVSSCGPFDFSLSPESTWGPINGTFGDLSGPVLGLWLDNKCALDSTTEHLSRHDGP